MAMDGASPPKSAVERMTLVLEAFDGTSVELHLDAVVSRTGLPRSTTHRLLQQLSELGWLEHGRAGYRLGPRVLRLGRSPMEGHGVLRRLAGPHLEQLAELTGLVAHLTVLDGAEILCLDKTGNRATPWMPSGVGLRAPAALTAEGRAMLALLDDATLATMLDHGDGDWKSGWLQQEMVQIRSQRGLAFNTSSTSGLSAVAVAFPHGDGIACLSLAGAKPLAHVRPMARLVTQAVAQIGAQLPKVP